MLRHLATAAVLRAARWLSLDVQTREQRRASQRTLMVLTDRLHAVRAERDELVGTLRGIVGDAARGEYCGACGRRLTTGHHRRCPVAIAVNALAQQTETEVRS